MVIFALQNLIPRGERAPSPNGRLCQILQTVY